MIRILEHYHHDDEIVILLPDPRVLRLIARSVLLAAALLSFPWLRTMLAGGSGPVTGNESDPKWVDNPFMLRMLVADLKREGLFNPELFSVFLGDPGSRGPFLKRNGMDLMSPPYKKMFVEDNSVDFVLAADGMTDSSFRFVDRVLKVGGIVAFLLDRPFCLPSNYRVTYVRRFGSTVVAIKKTSHGNADEFKDGLRSRRLLSVAKKKQQQQPEKTMYLVKLMADGNSSDGHLSEIDPGKVNGEFEVKEGVVKWFGRYAKGKEAMLPKAEAETMKKMKKAEAETEAETMKKMKKAEAETMMEMKKKTVCNLMDKIGLALYENI